MQLLPLYKYTRANTGSIIQRLYLWGHDPKCKMQQVRVRVSDKSTSSTTCTYTYPQVGMEPTTSSVMCNFKITGNVVQRLCYWLSEDLETRFRTKHNSREQVMHSVTFVTKQSNKDQALKKCSERHIHAQRGALKEYIISCSMYVVSLRHIHSRIHLHITGYRGMRTTGIPSS